MALRGHEGWLGLGHALPAYQLGSNRSSMLALSAVPKMPSFSRRSKALAMLPLEGPAAAVLAAWELSTMA